MSLGPSSPKLLCATADERMEVVFFAKRLLKAGHGQCVIAAPLGAAFVAVEDVAFGLLPAVALLSRLQEVSGLRK